MKAKNTVMPPAPVPTEQEIQKVAYRLWIEGGCRDGVETDNWFAAEELLRHRHGRVHPSHKLSAATTPATAPAAPAAKP